MRVDFPHGNLKGVADLAESLSVESYKGSLKVAATADVLDAVFAIDGQTLRVIAGQDELGSWSLADISVEQQGDGLYVNLAGEGIIVDVPDKEALIAAITGKAERRRPRQRRKRRSDRPSNKPSSAEVAESKTRSEPVAPAPEEPASQSSIESINQPMAQPIKRHKRDRVSLAEVADSARELLDRDNWDRWLNDSTVRWSIASATVIVFALMALFATNTLGMILILLGMVALIVAALAVSEDLSAYRIIPNALSETSLVIGGAAAMILGGLLILLS